MKKFIIILIILAAAALGFYLIYEGNRGEAEPLANGNNNNGNMENGFEQPQTREVSLFYYNPALDESEQGNIQCSREGLVSVKREIEASNTPIQDTIRLLLKGDLTEAEREAGITTEFPLDGFALQGANLANRVLTLEFNDPQNQTVGGSCRAGILWFQIEATAEQFEEVGEARFIPEELFQP